MLTRMLGRCDWAATAEAMRAFTEARDDTTPDKLWLAEHDPVFTQGVAGRAEHVLGAGDIPVLQTNRGGQVTYHGPGQVVAYPLVDLKRLVYLRQGVRLPHRGCGTEGAGALRRHRPPRGRRTRHLRAAGRPVRPCVRCRARPTRRRPDFAAWARSPRLGIKVSRHCTYHGVALNVAMDLEPFARINPCGYAGLETVDLSRIGITPPGTTPPIGLRQRVWPTSSEPHEHHEPHPDTATYDASGQAEGRGQDSRASRSRWCRPRC